MKQQSGDWSETSPLPPQGGQGAKISRYSWYVLGALTLLNAFNVGDRAILVILQESIKDEFALSDFQLGLLSGPAFALVYTLFGLPVAHFAGRRRRAPIIAAAIAIWSAMTALCGLTASFIQLAIARMGVGVGEAGFTPTAHALIADYVPAERRATALAVFSLGGPLGAVLLSVIGGFSAQWWGWRGAFLTLGGLGIVLAIIFRLSVREPPRSNPQHAAPKFGASVRDLLGTATFRWVLAAGIMAQAGLSVLLYSGSYLIRVHGLGLAQVALVQSVIPALTGGLGMIAGGVLADRLSNRFPRAVAVMPAIGLLIAGPLWALAFMTPSLPLYMVLFLTASLLQAPAIPLVFTIGQSVADPRSRATASALILLGTALIASGLGTPLIGAVSDGLSHMFMVQAGIDPATCAGNSAACAPAVAQGLRWALTGFACLFSVAGLLLFRASRTLVRDKQRWSASPPFDTRPPQ